LEVYNSSNQSIGTIEDVAFDGNKINEYILAAGGSLGLGEHYIAVRPSAIEPSFNTSHDKWHARNERKRRSTQDCGGMQVFRPRLIRISAT
jgi:hypothetical protein